MDKEAKVKITAFLILLSLTLLLGFPYFNVGLDRDEGMLLLMTSNLLHGGVPYRDLTESKPIAIYFFLALPVYLLGNWITGLRLFGLLLIASNAFMVFLIGRKLRDFELGFLSSFIFIFLQLFIPGMLGFLILSETVSNLFTLLAVYFLISRKPDRKNMLLVGLLSSLAFLTRQSGILLFAIIPIYVYFSREFKQKFSHLSYFFLGALSIIAVFTMYLFVNSALGDAIYNMFTALLDPYGPYAAYSTQEGVNFLKLNALLYFFFNMLVILFLMLIGIANLQNKKDRFILLWLVFSLGFVQASPSIFLHYYIIVLPSLSLLVGMGCRHILEMPKLFSRNKKIYYLSILASNITLAILLVLQFSQFISYPIFAMNTGKAYTDTLSYNDEIAIMGMLRNTTQNEGIFVFPLEPQVYYLTGKEPVSKMVSYTGNWFTHASSDQINELILEPLSEKKPEYVIITYNPQFNDIKETENGRALMQYIDAYYHPSKVIGIANIYEMN